ncbi:MAG TPA: ABC transporter permease [Vicinamibacterales bacterium]|nr:ABC transporter permease [Vicinamibacterales bacterium]
MPQDLRYALRTLLRTPVFTTIAVVCLALGIGVNTMIYAVVDGVLIQSFPYKDPDRLVVVSELFRRGGITERGLSYKNLVDWKERATSFATIAAVQYRSLVLADTGGEPDRYSGASVSWDLFQLLGQPVAHGRHFSTEDDRPNAEPVVILGDEIFQRRYKGDASVIGRRVLINARPHTVVGVMPPNFEFPENQKLYTPLAAFAHDTPRAQRNLFTFARLKDGTTIDQARDELSAVAARLAREYPTDNEGWTTLVQPLREAFIPDDVELVIWAMMAAVTLVLLIACANIANLLIAKASARQREISIRAALGAGRWRIVRQLLTEAVLLGLMAAPIGLALAVLGLRWLDSAIPPDDIPYYIHWSVDRRAMIYTIIVAILTGIVFGLAPAFQATRTNLHESLKEGKGTGGQGRRAWLRNTLVVVEVAASLVLLIAASLFVRSFMSLQDRNAGFDASPLMTLRYFMTGDAYQTPESRSLRTANIVRRVEALPGVRAAFASNMIPLGGGGGGGRVTVEGRSFPKGEEPSIGFTAVTPHMYRTLGVSVQRGRDFTDAEAESKQPLAIVNETMANRLWPNQDALGRRFKVAGEDTGDEWFTVIGVAADFFHSEIDDQDPLFPAAYVPYSWMPTPNTGLTIRVDGDPAQITAAVRAAIREADPNIPLFQIRTMSELRELGMWQYGLFGKMFSLFGALALFLASIGVYGVLSYAVSQRTQEIGVRVALGADRAAVLRLIVGQGLWLAGIGIVAGLILAVPTGFLIRTLLFVPPTDPISFVVVAVFLTLVAIFASYLPARRATAVDPLIALRTE